MIYLDHQASTPLDQAVFDEMLPYFTESAANPHASDHALGWAAAEAVERASAKVATLLGCDSDEIVFTSGATEANNLAILGLRQIQKETARNHVITTDIEHKSVLACCGEMASSHGALVETVNVNAEGHIDIDHLSEIASEQTLLLSVGAVNSEIGTIQNLQEIGAVAKQYGTFVHLDAAQVPAAIPLSNITDFADLVSLSAHKFYGPKGIGCLYVRRDLQPKLGPIIFGGGQQNGLRAGTLPVPLCVGMGAAASLICETPEIREHLKSMTLRLWNALASLPWEARLNGPPLKIRHPGNLNVMFPGFQAEELVGALQPHLAVSTGSACTTGTPEPSYVLRSIGHTYEEACCSIRLSPGKSTTEEDVAAAVEIIKAALAQLEMAGLKEAI